LVLRCTCGFIQAVPIAIPNNSFESPATVYVDTHIDYWQKTAKPPSYAETNGFLWDQLSGLFLNTSPASSDHIDNCDGSQSAYLFAVPDVGLLQDYDSGDWAHTNSLHSFNATFEAGKGYRLTVGIIGGGGGMAEGATLALSLYYREGASLIAVAVTNLVFTRSVFPTTTHLVDISLDLPAVAVSAPCVGKHIGIELLSTVNTNLEGGYWDVDNVRLSALQALLMASPRIQNGKFTFDIQSEPGAKFEVLAATDPSIPLAQWTSLRTMTNTAGNMIFSDPGPLGTSRFYATRAVP
jgi:hypothetical protein